MAEIETHTGSCHCGAVAFEVETGLDMVMECNCTHCFRTGVWLTFVEPEAFRLTEGEDAIQEYLFNTKKIRHFLCRTCGVETHGEGAGPDGKVNVAVNVRCLTDIAPFSVMPTTRFDGLHQI
ncbi:GFA family protein [Brevundimonas sp.]